MPYEYFNEKVVFDRVDLEQKIMKGASFTKSKIKAERSLIKY